MTTTRFQDLEQQIKTLQEEIDRLKKEEQETKLPKDFIPSHFYMDWSKTWEYNLSIDHIMISNFIFNKNF